MTAHINYLLETNLCLVFFYIAYWALFERGTTFGFNRFYLLGAILLSFLFPLIEISDNTIIPSIGYYIPVHFLPAVFIGQATDQYAEPSQSFDFWQIAGYFYGLGVLLLAVRFGYQLFTLRAIIRSCSACRTIDGMNVRLAQQSVPTFSVFNTIVMGNIAELSERDQAQIIRHEAVHVQKGHTWDMLLTEIVCIICWVNPITVRIRKKLNDVHEFQADEKAIEGMEVQQYCSLLARISLKSAGFSFANHFNKSLTVKRINMMKTIKKGISRWKVAAMLPLVVGIFAFVACQDQVLSEINEAAKSTSMAIDLPPRVQERLNVLRQEHPDGKYIAVEITDREGRARVGDLKEKYGSGPNKVLDMEMMEDSKRAFALLRTDGAGAQLADATKKDGDIFVIVEETAHPVDGMENLYAFITENLKYPTEAKRHGVNGRVFIEFVVEKDGTVTNLRSLKGIGYGCDEEAIRVLSMSPLWKPGMQRGKPVRQKMVMPVVFLLPQSGGSFETGSLEEVKLPMKIDILDTDTKGDKLFVRGSVRDEKGLPLAAANIIVAGTFYGTTTDVEGNFQIELNKGQQIVVSFVGYETSRLTF